MKQIETDRKAEVSNNLCLIVSGGPADRRFANAFVKSHDYSYVIAVDGGLSLCEELGVVPDLAVGDFDTFGLRHMEKLQKKFGWKTEVHQPEKNETDTELAIQAALDAGFDQAHMIGATGGRLDHELSNIHVMYTALDAGLFLEIYDPQNHLFLLTANDKVHSAFHKHSLYGMYVSFLPLTEQVLGITLEGFKYPLNQRNISVLKNPGLCVSNEVVDDEARISFTEGVLICVESKDQRET